MCATDTQTQRLVKVIACQDILTGRYVSLPVVGVTIFDFRRGEVVGSPALSYNLGANPLGSDVRSISIIASSFGPLPPPLPTARSITVARIMSPLGSTNLYGSSLLSGLRKYFKASFRLVKRGDILIIPTEIDPLTTHIATVLSNIPHVSDGNL